MNADRRCQACTFWDRGRQICTRDGSGWSGKRRDAQEVACAGFRGTGLARQESREEQLPALNTAVAQLGQYVGQLGMIIGAMQRRMEELEAKQAAVTVRHEDVKRLQALIRMRADEICGKYDLKDRESAKIFRAAIKKDLLKRFGVKDLHDVPAAMLGGAETMIGGWTNIRLAMERREAR